MAEDYGQRAAHATALSTQLRASGPVPMDVLAQRIIRAQALSHTALADLLAVTRAGASRTEDGLAALGCLARASKYAQEAAAALGTAMAQSFDGLSRSRSAAGTPVVTLGPPPHQLRQAAAALLERVAQQYAQASALAPAPAKAAAVRTDSHPGNHGRYRPPPVTSPPLETRPSQINSTSPSSCWPWVQTSPAMVTPCASSTAAASTPSLR
ncbi:hypothetical protein GCM10009864_25310 [Streptomyces lunalinharesii]|uniref:Uncharacterized protein n=1 Tax=Streptomyces lunalinharesii TaxID=333384 RepID=A0ABN3RPP6_9ACTN